MRLLRRIVLSVAATSWFSVTGLVQAQVSQDWREIYTPHDPNVLMTKYLLSFSSDTNSNLYVVCRARTPYVPLEQAKTGSLVAKFDSSGTYRWELPTLDPLYNHVTASGDSKGNSYVTGPQHWYDSVEHKGGYLGIQTMKVSPSGTIVYDVLRQCVGGNSIWSDWIHETGWIITYDAHGNAFVAGLREKAFPDPTVGNEIVILGYDPVGEQIFDITHTDGNDNLATDIVTSPDGSIFISGFGGPWGVSWQPLIVKVTSGVVDWSKYSPDGIRNVFHKIRVLSDHEGEPVLSSTNYNTSASQVMKYSGTGVKLWDSYLTKPDSHQDIDIDAGGYIYGGGESTLTKHDPDGNLLWTREVAQPEMFEECVICDIVAKDDAVYASGWVRFLADALWVRQFFTTKFDSAGNALWTIRDPLLSYNLHTCKIIVDDSARVYFAGVYTENVSPMNIGGRLILARYSEEDKLLTIRDANYDSIPNVEFELIRVADDSPWFTEEMLGVFTTDSTGRLELTPIGFDSFSVDLSPIMDTIVVGDNLKVSKHVYSEPAVKHPVLLGTMYSVYLDNAAFDENGAVSFDVLAAGDQDIILDHSEFRYNLVVSVEWDATFDYLYNLQAAFYEMANYLYDIVDGQVRLDTVLIYDDEEHWLEADVQIFASNTEWPRAYVSGIEVNTPGRTILLPRKWCLTDDNRNGTYDEYPYDLAESVNFRTYGHEFGHYAFGFYDEYLFVDGSGNPNQTDRCLTHYYDKYGFMDSQYDYNGGPSSEMSNVWDYNDLACCNTEQYVRDGMSCWDFLESTHEGHYGPDSLFVPIYKPDNRPGGVTPGFDYFVGPNEGTNDYDVGMKIHYPVSQTSPATFTLDVVTHDWQLHRLGNVDVVLRKPLGGNQWREISQGKTADVSLDNVSGGGIYVLGAASGDEIAATTDYTVMSILSRVRGVAASGVTSNWLVGKETVGGGGSLSLDLEPITGDWPLVCELSLGDSTALLSMVAERDFPSIPSVTVAPQGGTARSHNLFSTAVGYGLGIVDTLGAAGVLTILAVDDSASTFFFRMPYTSTALNDSTFGWLFGSEGGCEVMLDSSVSGLARGMILSSPYPIIRTGLDENAVQAGDAHSLSLYPSDSLEGTHTLLIRYRDADLGVGNNLVGNEAALAIYRWADKTSGWQVIGGSVDTADNVIYTPITQTGVYAAFTYDIITDVENEDHGGILPYQFELSQNYPNPFNPATTIEYSMPNRGHVSIEIYNVLGQRIRTLVDREEPAGSYTIAWDGADGSGKTVASGVYFYRFQAGDRTETKKMLLLK